jgi:mono/diheme cytochrome c family protein
MCSPIQFVLAVIALQLAHTACLIADDSAKPDLEGYRQQVAPLLANFCHDCHGSEDPSGKLSLPPIDPNLITGADFETWRMIGEQVRFGNMPPADADQPSQDERQTLLNWIRQELLKTQQPGSLSEEKLLLPQFGNYVDHEALFDQRRSHVTPAAPRLWRLRPDIYDTVAPRLADGVNGLANALNELDGSEFKDYAAPYFLDEASTMQLFSNAKKIAEAQLTARWGDRTLKELDSEEAPSAETVDSAIEVAFRKALGRGPTAAEKQRFHKLYDRSVEIGDHHLAARALLTAVLMQGEFVFRQELGEGSPDEHGRVRLSQREIAYALSYALDNQPIDEFVRAAENEQLTTAEQVADLVSEHLHDDSPNYEKNPRIMQFFREYFNYPFANEVFKDDPEGGEHNPARLVDDLEFTLKEILRRDEQVLAKLLTTRDFHDNVKYGEKEEAGKLLPRDTKTRKYQTAFNLPLDWKWGAHLQPVSFPADERAGVLTHPAWLAAWSGNFDNHPVQRGKWIRTHLLGGTVPDVPIGVDARVPEVEHKTFRQRLHMATNAAECWRCHKKMDPLGLPFERYDHYGRLQRLDVGLPVDTSGAITRTTFPELHAEVSGPTDMMDRLANSERVEQVFVRHAFRYFMGRNETLGDANTLQDAHRAYNESGGSFNALVVSLLSSDSFLYRQRADTP